MEPLAEFLAPESIDEAVAILAERGSAAVVLAGGTDVMVRAHRHVIPASVTTIVSLHRIAGMRGVRVADGELVVGAATTATDLIEDPILREHAPILARVADRMASAQIRNVATIGGNLVNASPAGDLISPLLLLDAELVLVAAAGERRVAVAEFFVGPGETVRKPEELLVEVRFTIPPRERVFAFDKAGTRPAMECSLITVGLAFTPRYDQMTDVRVAFGSLAPTPVRGRKTEAVLEGARPSVEVVDAAVAAADEDITPISDIRGSETYRRALAGVFLRRLLAETTMDADRDWGS